MKKKDIKYLETYRDQTVGLWATDRPDLVTDPKGVLFRLEWKPGIAEPAPKKCKGFVSPATVYPCCTCDRFSSVAKDQLVESLGRDPDDGSLFCNHWIMKH